MPNDRHNAFALAEMTEQKFTTGSLSQRKKSAGVDSAEMVEVVGASGKLEHFPRQIRRLKANKTIERKLGNAAHYFGILLFQTADLKTGLMNTRFHGGLGGPDANEDGRGLANILR